MWNLPIKSRASRPLSLLAATVIALAHAPGRAAEAKDETFREDSLDIEFSLPPAPLILGKVEQTTLTVNVKTPEGKPAEGCRVLMRSNVGTFSKQKSPSQGVYTFEYTLPAEYYPQYAIFGAVAACDGSIGHDRSVVPLLGSGEARVKAKPRSEVILRVGESTFGPVRSDKKGEALIPIVVPPGTEYGYSEGRKINLELPPFNRICASAETNRVKAKTGQTRLRIYVIDKKGNPAAQAKLTMTAKHGEVGDISRFEKGIYTALYRAPRSTTSLTDTVTVQLENDPESRSEVSIGIGSQSPTKVSISSSTESYRAGSGENITFTIAVTDDEGSPANGQVSLHSSFGKLTPPKKIETGLYRSDLTLPNRFDELDKATVRAEVLSPRPPHNKIDTELDIALLPADQGASLQQWETLPAIEPSVGFLTNFGNLNTALFSLEIQINLRFALDGLYALADGAYFFDVERAGNQGLSSTLHALPVFAGLGYRFRPAGHLNIFASAGGGPAFLWFEMKRPNSPALASRKAVPAVQGALGCSLDAGPGAVTATALYQWIEPNAFKALKGNLGGLGIEAGYRFSF